ncbi:MAG: hypothetical protein V1934_03895 [Methanobacteriota archaeon]
MKTAKLVALAVAAAMVAASLLVATPAKAADTNNDLFTTLPGAPVGVTFFDVAWSDDGKLALFVGTDWAHGKAYYYQPAGDIWTEATFGGGFLPCYVLYTVTYCPNSWNGPKFAGTGQCGGLGYLLWFAGPGQDTDYSSTSYLANFEVHDLAYNPGLGSMGTLYLCANDAPGNEVKILDIDLASGGFNAIMDEAKTSATLYGVEFDPATNDVYVVGVQGSGVLYEQFDYSMGTTTPLSFPYGQVISDIVFDSHHAPNRMIITLLYQGVGDVTSVYEARFSVSGYTAVTPIGQSPDYTYFNAIAMDGDGRAVLVGMDDEITTEGRIYDLWTTGSGTTHLANRVEGSIALEEYRGVAIRPTGVQMALVAGSAFKYSYTSVLGPIQVDTGVPHFNYIDIYPYGDTLAESVINSQVDVDIGDSMTNYTIEAEVYDPLGVARMQFLQAYIWHDGGVENQTLPTWGGVGFDSPGYENLRMHFEITAGGATTQHFPGGPDEETTLMGGGWSPINSTSAKVWLNFSAHQQVRWAAGPFTELPANMRYDPDLDGPEPEEQSTINALNDAGTWNMRLSVYDDAPTTNYAMAYDEFGFYKYTYLSTSGIPNGGAVYGSGAPGTPDVVMSVSGQNVTFAANCPYGLNAQLMGNLVGVTYAGLIMGNQISISGGNVGARTAFGVGGGTAQLIGPLQAPLDSERTTTTSSWDGNSATWEPVRWWVNIPGVVEDSYVSQVTWAIMN